MIKWLIKLFENIQMVPIIRERLSLKDDEIKKLRKENEALQNHLSILQDSEKFNEEQSYFVAPSSIAQLISEATANNQYHRIRVIAYTTETLDNFLPYDVYNSDLHIQILIRGLEAELNDESSYNKKYGDSVPRLWQKSMIIASLLKQSWPYKSHRSIRCFNSPPMLKAIILSGDKKEVAYFGFYQWYEVPKDGGSQFKGSKAKMFYLCSDFSDQMQVLETLNSQFEALWSYAQPLEKQT